MTQIMSTYLSVCEIEMICSSSRGFLRIPRAWQFANSYLALNRTGHFHFQENPFHHSLSFISSRSVQKGIHCQMDWNKKRKTVTPTCKPVSTQSSPLKDVMFEPENVASMVQVDDTVGETEGVEARVTSSYQNELEDNNNNNNNNNMGTKISLTTSAFQKRSELGDPGIVSTVDKEKHVSVEVGASVLRFIRGKDGSTQKAIEEDLAVKLKFPSSKTEESIIIEGQSLDAITRASKKIQSVVDEAVKSPAYQYSHFISLPLAIHLELVDKLVSFQRSILADSDPKDVDVNMDDVSSEGDEDKTDQPEKEPDVAVKLEDEDASNDVNVAINVPFVSYAPKTTKSPSLSELGIDKSIFIKPKTFHLTVLMLKLWNKDRVNAAVEVLQNVSAKVIEVLDNRPVFVRLKGLECMRGSRAKANVLYAPIEEIGNEDRLSRACQVITDAYLKAGLVFEKDVRQKLKLHATVMNTTHRTMRNRKGSNRSRPFDARGIFEQFGSEHWGDYHIREAHLSQRFLYDENGYYHCCASIPLPQNESTS